MKDETGGIAIEKCLRLKPKENWFLADNSEHKKAKVANRNVAGKIGHNEFKDVLLNNKCIRYSINIIQSKDHTIRTYETQQNFIVLLWR